jgi:5-methylcytosine-specific restriction enzyme subunit McrC
MRVIDLREEEMTRFPRASLQDSEVVALNRSGKFDIEAASIFNGQTYGVRSRGWIGCVPVSDQLLVRIAPKVEINNLFRMLEVAYNLRSFRLFDGEIGIESIDDVYERIVSILARRVLDRIRKGLFRGYFNESDELPYLRGRVDPIATCVNVIRGVPRISCHFEEHTADLEENQIIHWALHCVQRQALQRENVIRELDRARRALAGTISLKRYSPSDCVNRLYHRLNDDYAPMHGLCRFILEHSGPGVQAGDRTFMPFELSMPRLFEAFVAEWLRENPPSGMSVRSQYRAQLEANFEMTIHVDIVLCDKNSQRPLAVLDTKYKMTEQPTEADIYQVAFYARELGVQRAILVYPSPLRVPLSMRHSRNIAIEALTFDVTKPLSVAGPAFIASLC